MRRLNNAVSVLLGLLAVAVGSVSDIFWQEMGFRLLVRLKIISLLDEFDSIYSHPGRQLVMDWCVFFALILFFIVLQRWFPRFAKVALILHCFVGGIYTFLISVWLFINPFG